MDDRRSISYERETSEDSMKDRNAECDHLVPDVVQDEDMDTGQSLEDEEEESPRGSLSHRIRAPRAKRQKREESSAESTDDDDKSDEEELETTAPLSNTDKLISIGGDFQAVIMPATVSRDELEDRDEKIWGTPEEMDDAPLLNYVDEASGRYRLPIDRALYILRKSDYDFEEALSQASKRRELRDAWSKHEVSVFSTCFFHFGKRFAKIRAVMPHRTIASIVQFYYDSKKSSNYKTILDVKLNDTDMYDELMSEVKKNPRNPAGVCENCGEKAALLIWNGGMHRHECRACVLYFRLMRTPRPAGLRISAERARRNITCPEYMKQYVVDYEKLMEPADGMAIERLGIGSKKEHDEDCMIIDECPLRQPSAPYIVEMTENDDPVDSNTCRMTRDFESAEVQKTIDNIRKANQMSVPLVWRQKQNKCMEDIELLNEESRRTNAEISETISRVNINNIAAWKKDMSIVKSRMDAMMNQESESVAGSRSGRVRCDHNWSEEEKMDAVRCFHWYNDDFDSISEVMGTKTSEQVKSFYEKNKEVIDESIETYRQEIRSKIGKNL